MRKFVLKYNFNIYNAETLQVREVEVRERIFDEFEALLKEFRRLREQQFMGIYEVNFAFEYYILEGKKRSINELISLL
jgi:predicted transcriptional regulator